MKAQQLPACIERPADSAGVFAIWPGSGVPETAKTWTWREQTIQVRKSGSEAPTTMTRNVVIPTVTMFTPESRTAGPCAIGS